jgi:hypothetical protein
MTSNYPRAKKTRAKTWAEQGMGILPASLLIGAFMLGCVIQMGNMIDEKPLFSPTVSFFIFIVLPMVALREIWLTRLYTLSQKALFYGLSCCWSSLFTTVHLSHEENSSLTSAGAQIEHFFSGMIFHAWALAIVFAAVYGFAWLKKQYFPSDADYRLEPEGLALPEPMMPVVPIQSSEAPVSVPEEKEKL